MKYIITILFYTGVCSSISSQHTFIEDFKLKWQNAKEYTLEFARAMPAEKYTYTPTPEEMTFGRQLIHMCGNMIWLSSSYLDAPPFGKDVDHPSEKKEDVIRLLEESFDYTARAIEKFPITMLDDNVDFFAGPMTKRRVFLLLTDHVTHHRGQLVVYLRLNGIEPPRYRGW
ncbi:MAG TPA: DinB family protein [Saprospiraceae bacterium]|nr:DinB family protein [Saprospiraceae bacterium]